MKLHRQILAAALTLCMTAALWGCGHVDSDRTEPSDTAVSQSADANENAENHSGAENDAERDNQSNSKSNADEASENASGGADSDAISNGSAGNSGEKAPLPEIKIGSGVTIGIEPLTASPGEKAVPVSVKIWNNPGYVAAGIQVYYDEALTPVASGKVSSISGIPEAKIDVGAAAQGFMTSCLIGEEKRMIAFGAMSMDTNDTDGTIFTLYFDVPDSAEPGTDYTFLCTLDSVNDENSQPLDCTLIDGILRIE